MKEKKQATRRTVLLVSLLLFPITLNYFSPYLIINGAFVGVLAGSALMFISFFVFSIFLGRFFCGYLCPAGGIQEVCAGINTKTTKPGLNRVKWAIWLPWFGAILAGFIVAGGIKQINPFYMTETGFSVAEARAYFIYLPVVFLVLILTLTVGKRAFCHAGCWMAPFLIIGSEIGEKVNLPRLGLRKENENCIACGACTKACPMSLNVQKMVETAKLYNRECILCSSCESSCPKKVLLVRFGRR
ncbi:MAG TPA: 4Fe-4S binding protein [Anaerolineaceae bacterium]|nr:4Fe-4S binding protein [Anaerolineaceae bacterium]